MMMQLPAALLLLIAWGGEFTIARTPNPPIVIRATGQVSREVTIGKPLPRQSAFGLQRGDVLSLLDAKGVRILKGPGVLANGTFTPTGSSAPDGFRIMATTDASEATEKAQTNARSGTRGFSLSRPKSQSAPMKAASAAAHQPRQTGRPWHLKDLIDSDWLVDASKTGLICLPEGAQPVLYREDASSEAEVRVSLPDGGSTFTWLPKQEVAPWPVSAERGQAYTLSVGESNPLVVQIIGLAMDDPATGAPLSVHQSCIEQAELNALVREEQALSDSLAQAR